MALLAPWLSHAVRPGIQHRLACASTKPPHWRDLAAFSALQPRYGSACASMCAHRCDKEGSCTPFATALCYAECAATPISPGNRCWRKRADARYAYPALPARCCRTIADCILLAISLLRRGIKADVIEQMTPDLAAWESSSSEGVYLPVTTMLAFQELGVNSGTLANWVARDRRAHGGDGRLSEDERAELARLRRENAELAMERDVLKRSVALWVKDAMGR